MVDNTTTVYPMVPLSGSSNLRRQSLFSPPNHVIEPKDSIYAIKDLNTDQLEVLVVNSFYGYGSMFDEAMILFFVVPIMIGSYKRKRY